MASFSFVSRNSNEYSSIANIDTKQKIYEYSSDKRQVTVYEYNPDKKIDISVYIFLDILNSIAISKNALDICNSIECHDLEIRQKALNFGLTYKNIFNGDNKSYNARKVLDIINCDVNPKINIKTFTSICFIKWKIYEINEKNKKKYKNNRNNKNIKDDDDNISEWVGVLSGLVLYFDELDESNYNTTIYSKDICKAMTSKDI
jgi:hypothetical protein